MKAARHDLPASPAGVLSTGLRKDLPSGVDGRVIHQNGIIEKSRQMIDKKLNLVALVAKNGNNAQFQLSLPIQFYSVEDYEKPLPIVDPRR